MVTLCSADIYSDEGVGAVPARWTKQTTFTFLRVLLGTADGTPSPPSSALGSAAASVAAKRGWLIVYPSVVYVMSEWECAFIHLLNHIQDIHFSARKIRKHDRSGGQPREGFWMDGYHHPTRRESRAMMTGTGSDPFMEKLQISRRCEGRGQDAG